MLIEAYLHSSNRANIMWEAAPLSNISKWFDVKTLLENVFIYEENGSVILELHNNFVKKKKERARLGMPNRSDLILKLFKLRIG